MSIRLSHTRRTGRINAERRETRLDGSIHFAQKPTVAIVAAETSALCGKLSGRLRTAIQWPPRRATDRINLAALAV